MAAAWNLLGSNIFFISDAFFCGVKNLYQPKSDVISF